MNLSRFRTDEAGVTAIEYGLIWSYGELTGYPRVDQAAKVWARVRPGHDVKLP